MLVTDFPSHARRLVSGAGDIKLTKDGNILLHEMVCSVPLIKYGGGGGRGPYY